MGPHRLRGREVVIEEASEVFPHFRAYAECQNKATMFGSFTFLSMASGVYVAQELMKSKLPFGRKSFLLAPIVIGSLSAYLVTQHNTRICQRMWMALEEKHTVITPASERLLQSAEDLTESAETLTETLPELTEKLQEPIKEILS